MSNWDPKANEIFLDAQECDSPECRHALIEAACGPDSELRRQVESLLAADQAAPSVLDRHAAELPVEYEQIDRVGTRIGSYKIREQIGEGGMGEVYVAEQTEPVRRKVALKIIKPGMATKDVVARFEAERQALAMMDHPNIAKVFDGGAIGEKGVGSLLCEAPSGPLRQKTPDPFFGQPYFVMELVQGPPITEYCDEHRLSTRERLELFGQVCRALRHAHQKGIIHRDLKPSNILVPRIDGAAVPKVIDFGVAKAVGQTLTERTLYTQFSQMVGTPLYMSPEQAEPGVVDVDIRSDVYSLGVLLYELLTGHTPFDSESLKQAGFDEMRRIIREDEPLRPSVRVSTLKADALSTVSDKRRSDPRKLSGELQGELDWLVMKCLEKDRSRRYESASALAVDIQRYLAGEAVEACPPSRAFRLRKFAGRHRIALATATAIAAALVAGVVGTTWQMLRAMDAETTAQEATITARDETNRAQAEAARANAERERAVESLRLARSVVDSLYMQLGTQWIADETAPSDFQRGILAAAGEFYQQLADIPVRDSTDLSDLSLAASGYGRIGTIQHYLENYEEAVEARRKTIEIVQQARALAPHVPAIRSTASEIHYELGQSLAALARYHEALEMYETAASFASELAQEGVDAPQHHYWVARANLARAAALTQAGSLTEAVRVAEAAKSKLDEISPQGNGPLDRQLRSERIRAGYWLARLRSYQGRVHDGVQLGQQALQRFRRARATQQDDIRLRNLEWDLEELAAELAGLQEDVPAAIEAYRRVLDMRRETFQAGMAPERLINESFYNSKAIDGMAEPGPFCDYVETQLRLADVLRRADRPYEAEDILGECRLVTSFVAALRPNALRYRVAEANVWAEAAELLADHRPAEAELIFRRARQIWAEAIEEFPHAKDYVSGVHGLQPDWKRFDQIGRSFADLPFGEDEVQELNVQETVWFHHTEGRSNARIGRWEAAIRDFERSAALRTKDHAYDWLQLAIAHVKLGQQEEAQLWFDKAARAIGEMTDPHLELVELQDEASLALAEDEAND